MIEWCNQTRITPTAYLDVSKCFKRIREIEEAGADASMNQEQFILSEM